MLDKRIPADIKDDYVHYKIHAPCACLICNSGFSANFTNIKFENDIIYFWHNCLECGENFYYYTTSKKLKEVMIKYFCDPRVDPQKYPMNLWLLFRLGRWYQTCFEHKTDEAQFRLLWRELNKHLYRWGWWYKWRYK